MLSLLLLLHILLLLLVLPRLVACQLLVWHLSWLLLLLL